MARKIQVEIVGDARSLERAFKRAGTSGDSFNRKMATLGKVIGVGIGGGILAFGFAMKRGFSELANAQKVAAQTNAVLRSTGGIANVSAKRVDKLAMAISRMSGIDDEAVAEAENLLLTFTNIRNGLGKGNKIFDQATRATLDLSVATGKDLGSAAIMVGKALNDLEVNSRGTITGWSALRRVGVMVTADMMKQGAAFIKAGKPMKAQRLLLGELNTEFGGSAKAFGNTMPGALGKLRNAFDELMAAFATGFLPIILKVANALTKKLANPAFVARVQNLGTLIGTTLYNAFAKIAAWFEANWPAIKQGILSFGVFIRKYVIPPLRVAAALIERIAGGVEKLVGWLPNMQHKVTTPEQVKKLPEWAQSQIGEQLTIPPAGGKPPGRRAGKKRGGDTGLWGGPRARGGPVTAGMAYRVGERGPEMFVPGQNGNIVPGGGGGPTHIHVHVGSHKVAEAILGDIQRLSKRGASQQRGRLGGQNLALS